MGAWAVSAVDIGLPIVRVVYIAGIVLTEPHACQGITILMTGSTNMIEPIKRKPMQHSKEMKRSLERVKELYPENTNFNLSAPIGPYVERRKK